jgi:ketosteroid isomerase-like protein
MGGIMTRIGSLLAVVLFLIPSLSLAQSHIAAEDAVWSREVAYWKTAQSGDLNTYYSLWSDDFLGWPFSSHDPMHKAHVADWITSHATKGEHLKSYSLERLSVQVSGSLAITTYRVRATWVGGNGEENTGTNRVLHAWRRYQDGTWRIFSGMSAPAEHN